MKRALAVTFCLALLVTLAVVFTRVIAARIPEQRATLERLITERTGLDVRFDNVRFAWDLEGTSAVFTRVELMDPRRGRVHVLAPELRVELDTWDFLRHHQFSLGHVKLASPDIELFGDPDESLVDAVTSRALAGQAGAGRTAAADEAAVVRRYLGWARLMPAGRIEVEGARVHLRRRGEPSAYHSFTLSQAVVSRSGQAFSAYGTMLLAQDVGQSLFVSAKLEGVDTGMRMSGALRLIARRVFLDKLGVPGLGGRGTIDARLALRDGRVETGSWEASARELAMSQDTRFDHVTVNGKLSRQADDVLLDFTDLQITRGARLERAPALSARLALEPGAVRVARTTVQAERIPFMAAEFIAGLLAPQASGAFPPLPGGWLPTAGELHGLHLDAGRDDWEFSAQATNVELTRPDRATLAQISARVRADATGVTLIFGPSTPMNLRTAPLQEPRVVSLDGSLELAADGRAWRFGKFSALHEASRIAVDGSWQPAGAQSGLLQVAVTRLDHALLGDLWRLASADAPLDAPWSQVQQGSIEEGTLELASNEDGAVDWGRSRGTLALAGLATTGEDAPRLSDGRGRLSFARGGAQLVLDAGQVEDLAITAARVDWPRKGAPHLHATMAGQLDSRMLRGVLAAQGLDRLAGAVAIETDARGERELRSPELWRVTARVSGASVPLAGGLPPVESLAGTIRYSGQQLRALSLQGSWLGGPVEIESRRAGARPAFTMNGVADAAPLLKLLGGAQAAGRVTGQLAWNATAQAGAEAGTWQLTLGSNLGGVESRLPQPFDKARGRALPVSAELRLGPEGVREFSVDGRELSVRGQMHAGLITAHFEVQGVSGDLRRAASRGASPEVTVDVLDLRRAPAVLAAAGAVLPLDGEVALRVRTLNVGDHDLGMLQAAVSRVDQGVEFSLDTSAVAPHQLSARGNCNQDLCRVDFTADTAQLASLLRDVKIPAEWPAASLHASGELEWPAETGDLSRTLAGKFDLSTKGESDEHQMSARASLADGQILLSDVQGSGPAPDQVFRGTGRVGLLARDYDVTVDYDRVALAATAVPSPARAPLTRAWNAVRGSVARRGWAATDVPETRRVQWHGNWD